VPVHDDAGSPLSQPLSGHPCRRYATLPRRVLDGGTRRSRRQHALRGTHGPCPGTRHRSDVRVERCERMGCGGDHRAPPAGLHLRWQAPFRDADRRRCRWARWTPAVERVRPLFYLFAFLDDLAEMSLRGYFRRALAPAPLSCWTVAHRLPRVRRLRQVPPARPAAGLPCDSSPPPPATRARAPRPPWAWTWMGGLPG
jgi:hypothetical protein